MADTLLEAESVQISRIGTRAIGMLESVESYWIHFKNSPKNNTFRINNNKKYLPTYRTDLEDLL